MRTLSLPLATLLIAHVAHAASTSGWRADGTGLYPSAKPVLEWSTTKNVLWKTPLPDKGNSMPVLVGDKLFLTVEPNMLFCFSAPDGQILWKESASMEETLSADQKENSEASRAGNDAMKAELDGLDQKVRQMARSVRQADGEEKARLEKERSDLRDRAGALREKLSQSGGLVQPATHDANGYASATPVSDGERVFVVYGTGVVAAYDLEGKRLWIKLHEQPAHQWGHSTSPRLVDGKLIVHLKSMMALDPDSGEIVWKAEIPESWGTPAVGEINGVNFLVTAKGDIVRASDGKRLASSLFELPYGAPIIHDGVIYGIDEKGGSAFALPDKIEGDAIQVKKLWTNDPPKDRYYSSPVVIDGVLYAINRGQRLSAIEAATGAILYSEPVDLGRGQQLYASFSLAGDHLFVGHDNGQIAVLKPGRELKVVASNPLEASRSTPIFEGDRMYFRTEQNLYCIGSK